MMKKLLFLTICLLLIVSVGANAQWKFVKYFPDTTTLKYWMIGSGSGINNGIAVDPAGNVWLQSFSATCDTLKPAKWPTGCIRVFTPRGVELPFSPIYILTGKDQNGVAVTDTMSSLNSGNWGGTGYGLTVDPSSGNIISNKGGSRIWKIDYKTGKGIVRIAGPFQPAYASSLSTCGVDNYGEIFVAPVTPTAGVPLGILNPDMTSAGNVATQTQDYCRAVAVSGDGNDVYAAFFSQQKMMIFHSDNGSLGPYAKKDSILGCAFETAVWHPKTGNLWTTSGNVTSGNPTGPYGPYKWIAFDVKTKKVTDSLAWYDPQIPMYGNDQRPRGIAFNKTGDTAYVAVFNSNVGTPPSWVEVFAKSGATAVEQETGVIPTGYTLSQNYPNPFNPTTQIRFTLTQSGMTSLKVYDLMGREVATLVDENMTPGAYTVKFDASHLSSGTYMYVLTSGSVRLTNKMVLVK